jgi:hypothetical protein
MMMSNETWAELDARVVAYLDGYAPISQDDVSRLLAEAETARAILSDVTRAFRRARADT